MQPAGSLVRRMGKFLDLEDREMAKIQQTEDSQPFRCRRYVGNRPRARDGECGLAAQLVLNGQPLCYVHTPVAYRRQLAAVRVSARTPRVSG